jgi:pimeloyl-ACP methyl ester carboxylesterase
MKTFRNIALALATTLAACAGSPDVATTPTTAAPKTAKPAGSYASVNGVDMYYEVHGTGRPLVLIHGAFCTIQECFSGIIPTLAKSRQVIAVELQGHGHTRDIDRPLSFDALAGDVVALLDQLGIAEADILGYSMGAGVALELTLDRPERVRTLTLTGYGISSTGYHPGVLEGIEHISPEVFAGSSWEKAYLAAAPDPSQWSGLIEKIKVMTRGFQGWTDDQVRSVKAPVLVLAGDSDIVTPEHLAEMFRLFGGAVAGDVAGLPEDQLAILPGTTHVTIIQRGAWVAEIVGEFVDRK